MSIDVENLIGRTPLSADVYKTFRSADPQTESTVDSHDTRQEFVAARIFPAAEIMMEPMQTPMPTQAPPTIPQPRSNKRFGALRSVMMGDTSAAQTSDKATQQKPAPAIKVIGAGGGTGVTTILATLARTLSKNGECAVVVEADPDSVLSYHFGITEKRSEIHGLQIAPTVGGHPVFLLQRPHNVAGGEKWIEQSLTPLESTGYRILMDSAVEPDADCDVLNLVVLTPDLGSVHRLDNILNALDGKPALFVLNKFDASISLHEQVREWMLQKIGDRLVTIGRTDAIAESLAEGSTILDYASTSPVTADFHNLLRAISLATTGVCA